MKLPFPPRLIRARHAPGYLGMDRNRFTREVKPHVSGIKIGIRGVAYDRRELDRWADKYIQQQGITVWQGDQPDSTDAPDSGTLTSASEDTDVYVKALARGMRKRRKSTSHAA